VQRYIIRRLVQAAVALFTLSLVVFLLLRLTPGADPALLRCGIGCKEERRQAIREELGLKDNYLVQYATWGKQLVTGSLGTDANNATVAGQLRHRLPTTLELLIIGMLLTVSIGISFGVVSAVFRNSLADYSARFAAILGLAVPSFWLATLVLLIPQQFWDYAPPLGRTIGFLDSPWDNLRQFVPAAFVLAVASAAGVMRLTRSALLDVMRQDYVRTARAKGLRERTVVSRHALKNSLIPVITLLGLQMASLFSGSIIIETIFNLQGVGQYFFNAMFAKDFQVAQTLTLYVGAVVLLINLVVDVGYAWLDPRIRYA